MPSGDESCRISLHYKALSSSTVWVVCHLLRGDNCDIWPHTKAIFSPKKSWSAERVISTPLPYLAALVSGFLELFFTPGCLFLLLLRLLWHAVKAPSFSLLLHSERDTERPLKTPITHHGLFVVVSLSLRKLNSDFFRSTMAVGCTRCRHIVAVDGKTQHSHLMSFQQIFTQSISQGIVEIIYQGCTLRCIALSITRCGISDYLDFWTVCSCACDKDILTGSLDFKGLFEAWDRIVFRLDLGVSWDG